MNTTLQEYERNSECPVYNNLCNIQSGQLQRTLINIDDPSKSICSGI